MRGLPDRRVACVLGALAVVGAVPPAQAQVRISSLPAAATLTGGELIPGVQGGSNVAISSAQIKTFAGGGGSSSGGVGSFSSLTDSALTIGVDVCADGAQTLTSACANAVAIGDLAQIAANTVLGNGTGSAANVTALATTGAGAVVEATSPILTTPVLGAATAATINGLTINATTGALTIANGKTATVNNTLTFGGTDGTTMIFPAASSTVMTVASPGTLTGQMTCSTGCSMNLSGAASFKANSQMVVSNTAPTITSGLGTSPAVTNSSGTAAFLLTAGAAGSPTTTTLISMPSASHGWMCDATDLTTNSEIAHETATSTSSITLTWYALTTGTATAPSNSDQIAVKCSGY